MKKLNYTFKDAALLDLAMTQSGADAVNNNERLEFIGDRILGLAVATLLFDMFPTETEGELARRHAVLVSTETLGTIAKSMGLDKKLRRGHMTAGRVQHILANAMEATLGAIFIDGGFNAATTVIHDLWRDLAAADKVAPKDPKTSLQEFVQHAQSGALPEYKYFESKGASHNPVFKASVTALGHTAVGTGASKKSASISAAEALLEMFSEAGSVK